VTQAVFLPLAGLVCATRAEVTPPMFGASRRCIHGLTYFPHNLIDWSSCALCPRFSQSGCTTGAQNSRNVLQAAPSWNGEPHPEKYDTVSLKSRFLSSSFIRRLHTLGFPRNAMQGFCPLSNRYENQSAEGSKASRYRERLAREDTVTAAQFQTVTVNKYISLRIKEGLRHILVNGGKVAEVAAEIGLPKETLKKRAQRLRKEIAEQCPRTYLHAAVEEAINLRESRFQRYQFQKGLLSYKRDDDGTCNDDE
jgi:hypothetical protein